MAVVCPNCGKGVRGGETVCPFCGADLHTKENTGKPNQAPLATDTKTAATLGCGLMAVIYYFCGASYYLAGDMLFAAQHSHGAFAHQDQSQWLFWRAYGTWIGFGAPIILTGLAYLLLRKRYPAFARGLGYSAIVALAVALGAPFLCGHN